MKPTRRRVLLGLGAAAGGAGIAYVGRDQRRVEKGVSGASETATKRTGETEREETTTETETTTERETTTDRDVEFPEQFVEFSFDTRESLEKFTERSSTQNVEIGERGISSDSNSLRVTFREGRHYGTSLQYQFDEAGYPDPEELHVRYYLRFGTSFEVPYEGGKLPGPAGTYGQAGWGGRQADGTNGWSGRMYFYQSDDSERPVQLANYVYHAEMDSPYGDVFHWDRENAGRLQLGKWYRIDNYVKLNTPGQDNGVLKGWVDGERALKATDLRFRDVPRIRIDKYWFDCYWGGSVHPSADHHVYFDQLELFSESQETDDWDGTEMGVTPIPETETTEAETTDDE